MLNGMEKSLEKHLPERERCWSLAVDLSSYIRQFRNYETCEKREKHEKHC